MPNYVYPAIGLIGGGTGALDAIDGTALADKDMAMVSVQGDKTYFYVLNATSGAAEASPGIIAPDANGGDKRWILTGFTPVPAATGFTIAGGTTSKTLTVSDTMTLALGAANLKQFMNAAGTGLEWANGIKVYAFDYDTATASGNQAVTSVGFQPSNLIFLGIVPGTSQWSVGFDNGSSFYSIFDSHVDAADTFGFSQTKSIVLYQAAGILCEGKITSLDVDGFTIAWTKTGAKTGTAYVAYMAFR